MKHLSTILAVSAIAAGSMLSSCVKQHVNTNMALKNDVDSASYAIGMMNGMQFHDQFDDVNIDAFMAGLENALKNDTAHAKFKNPMEMQMYLRGFLQKKAEQKAADNLKKGQEFLAEVAKTVGIQKTPSGILYEVIKDAQGEKATINDTVEVDYVGTLIDGTEFDNSIKRGQPAKFPLTHIIKGWQEVIPMMPLGSKWKVYIPAELGYGERGNQVIPANSVLIFEIELHQIMKGKAPEAPAAETK